MFKILSKGIFLMEQSSMRKMKSHIYCSANSLGHIFIRRPRANHFANYRTVPVETRVPQTYPSKQGRI